MWKLITVFLVLATILGTGLADPSPVEYYHYPTPNPAPAPGTPANPDSDGFVRAPCTDELCRSETNDFLTIDARGNSCLCKGGKASTELGTATGLKLTFDGKSSPQNFVVKESD